MGREAYFMLAVIYDKLIITFYNNSSLEGGLK